MIVKFDNKPIVTSSDLPRVVGATKPGKIAPVEVLRKGTTKMLNVGVGEMPSDPTEVAQAVKPSSKPEVNRIGLTLRELTPQQKKKLNGKEALLVVDAQGPVAQAGVRRGDLVLGLNNTEVQNIEQFNKLLASFAAGKTVAILILRGESTLYVPIKIPAGK